MIKEGISSFLRDPIWQFIDVGVAILAILITIYFSYKQYKLQRQKKSLSYKYITFRLPGLKSAMELSKGRIKILCDDKPIVDAVITVLEIFNDGNIPIVPSDFEKPITFVFGEESEIISAEIYDKSPENIYPNIHIEGNNILVEPLLLNPNDSFSIQILFSNYTLKAVKCDARIVGIREIHELIKPSGTTAIPYHLFILAVFLVSGIFLRFSSYALINITLIGLILIGGYYLAKTRFKVIPVNQIWRF